jgi:hypothetical protein
MEEISSSETLVTTYKRITTETQKTTIDTFYGCEKLKCQEF